MAWILLGFAITFSITANALLKQSDGFANVGIGVASFALFGISIYIYGIAVKTLPLAIAYTVWSGIGILVITFIGIFWFKEPINALGMVFIAMILVGCIGLNMITKV
jgi:small multidrug resistance pump